MKRNWPMRLLDLALKHKDSGQAVLVFVRTVEDVEKVVKKLPKDSTEQLTGTLRGLERDGLVQETGFPTVPASRADRDENVTPALGQSTSSAPAPAKLA